MHLQVHVQVLVHQLFYGNHRHCRNSSNNSECLYGTKVKITCFYIILRLGASPHPLSRSFQRLNSSLSVRPSPQPLYVLAHERRALIFGFSLETIHKHPACHISVFLFLYANQEKKFNVQCLISIHGTASPGEGGGGCSSPPYLYSSTIRPAQNAAEKTDSDIMRRS